LWEVNEAARSVSEAAHPEANIIFGAMVDEKLSEQVWVTVVATGFDGRGPRQADRDRAWMGRIGSTDVREPRGEPRISRARQPAFSARGGDTGSVTEPLDVPEFIPRR
jgi:cell division protein FtsZ